MLLIILRQGLPAVPRKLLLLGSGRAADILFLDGILECPIHSRPIHDKATIRRIRTQRFAFLPRYKSA